MTEAHQCNALYIQTTIPDAYLKIEHIDPVVKVGDEIRAGQPIGEVYGYRGNPHIHMYGLCSLTSALPDRRIAFNLTQSTRKRERL